MSGGVPAATSLGQPGTAPRQQEEERRARRGRRNGVAGRIEEEARTLVERRCMTARPRGDGSPETATVTTPWGGYTATPQRAVAQTARTKALTPASPQRGVAGPLTWTVSPPSSFYKAAGGEGEGCSLRRESDCQGGWQVNQRGGDEDLARAAAERDRHIFHGDANENSSRSIDNSGGGPPRPPKREGPDSRPDGAGAANAVLLPSFPPQSMPLVSPRVSSGNAGDSNISSLNENHGGAAARVASAGSQLLDPLRHGGPPEQHSGSRNEESDPTPPLCGEASPPLTTSSTLPKAGLPPRPGEPRSTPRALPASPPKPGQDERRAEQTTPPPPPAPRATPVQWQRAGPRAGLGAAEGRRRSDCESHSLSGTEGETVSANSFTAAQLNTLLGEVATSRPSASSARPAADRSAPAVLRASSTEEAAGAAHGVEPQVPTPEHGTRSSSVSAPSPSPRKESLPRDENQFSRKGTTEVDDSAKIAVTNPYEVRFRNNSFANGRHGDAALPGEAAVVVPVAGGAAAEAEAEAEATELAGGRSGARGGRQQDPTADQQWLQVPSLFCLVFNLIKLHESRAYQLEDEREREVSEMLGEPKASVTPRQDSVALSASLQDIYVQLSHAFCEVSGVLLNPYLTSWSDAGLRRAVAQVANAWKRGGPHSEEFEVASLHLLEIVSADRSGKVTPTPLYRLWSFIGTRRRSPYFICGALATTAAMLVALALLTYLGAESLVARVVLAALLGFALLLSAAVCVLLFSHNSVAEEVREFYFAEMMKRLEVVMRDVDAGDDEEVRHAAHPTSAMASEARSPQYDSLEHVSGPLQLGDRAAQDGHNACGSTHTAAAALPTSSGGGVKRPPLVLSPVTNPGVADPQRLTLVGGACTGASYGPAGGGGSGVSPVDQSLSDDRGGGSASQAPLQPFPQGRRAFREEAEVVGDRCCEPPAAPPEEAVLPEDCYNALLMSRVSFERTQLAEERMKELMVCKSIGLDAQAARHSAAEDAGVSPLSRDLASASTLEGAGGTASPVSLFRRPRSVRLMRDSLASKGLDEVAITALVYCRSNTLTADSFDKLWSRNFLILQRKTLEALDAAFHRGSERFKVFLLHAPDLDKEQLRTALAWSQQERRSVFFFASALGTMSPEVPYAFRLELPLTTRDVEAIQLSGIGVDEEMNSMSVFRPSRQFKVPQYTLGRRLGGGAFGNVFEVEMESMGARCAVKRMYLRGGREEGADGVDSQLKEIAGEVEIMSSLSHPNIVQYFFCERDDNCVSIFMELCSGGSLSELIAAGGLRRAEVIKHVLRDVIAAVVYLHGKHIVHRDLKPENVLFRCGRAKVSDFGTAVFKLGGLTNVKGTFAYMAPEVLLGETYGKACDVWSFGCIAADTLSVRLANRPLGMPEACELYRRMPPDATLDFDCDEPTVRGFLELCLKRDPVLRSSAQELLEHPMLTEENAAVQRWLATCAERRGGRQADGGPGSLAQGKYRVGSASVVSLRSAEVLGPRCTPQQTPTTPSFF
ncbi:putative protein kinase [Trypanosoma conorhini]|uniref:Protein kinase domain-containing protein n=1 Tax=Trypanosoma conorhini TaxID=83891 RepID=A0A3R7MYR9_9TRYP|nr:putative protein kinase [Trypanosoma conorhini]RNF10126.1 putative protein kinase [Trypanosoma conorhini]